MKMAIVKKVKKEWMITGIGLSDLEISDLRNKLKKSDEDPDYRVEMPYRVVFHQSED